MLLVQTYPIQLTMWWPNHHVPSQWTSLNQARHLLGWSTEHGASFRLKWTAGSKSSFVHPWLRPPSRPHLDMFPTAFATTQECVWYYLKEADWLLVMVVCWSVHSDAEAGMNWTLLSLARIWTSAELLQVKHQVICRMHGFFFVSFNVYFFWSINVKTALLSTFQNGSKLEHRDIKICCNQKCVWKF